MGEMRFSVATVFHGVTLRHQLARNRSVRCPVCGEADDVWADDGAWIDDISLQPTSVYYCVKCEAEFDLPCPRYIHKDSRSGQVIAAIRRFLSDAHPTRLYPPWTKDSDAIPPR